MKKFKFGDELTFYVNGQEIKGTYIAENDNLYIVQITKDFTGNVGQTQHIKKEFLIDNEALTKNV